MDYYFELKFGSVEVNPNHTLTSKPPHFREKCGSVEVWKLGLGLELKF